jgi:large conductance mechanosensitive channel
MLKEFALRGNLVDIAIGFVVGAAFKEVVGALTGGIISPLVGLIFKTDFKDLKYIVQKHLWHPTVQTSKKLRYTGANLLPQQLIL